MSMQDYIDKDYYKILGVTKDADAGAIKRAWRKIAKENHPDKFPGDAVKETRYKEASEANDVLSDPAKRKEYDEARAMFAGGGFRPGAYPGGGMGGPGGPGGFNVNVNDIFSGGGADLGGLFDDLFGGGRGGGGGGFTRTRTGRAPGSAPRGQDVEAAITLDFEEAVRGTTIPLKLSGPAVCTLCGGSGARPGTSAHACPTCGGSGHVTSNMGGFGFSEPCRTCRGTGRIPDSPCPQCNGSGVTDQVRTITVRVPAGMKDGAKLRLAGKGQPGPSGGPAGDLFVTVHVGGHRLFGRKGDDLTLAVPITFSEAALGATVRVPTLDGAVSVKIPAGTPSGRTLRVRGRGVPKKSGAGDLLVTVEVAVPQKLSPAAREALEAFAAASPEDPRSHLTAAVAAADATTAAKHAPGAGSHG